MEYVLYFILTLLLPFEDGKSLSPPLDPAWALVTAWTHGAPWEKCSETSEASTRLSLSGCLS